MRRTASRALRRAVLLSFASTAPLLAACPGFGTRDAALDIPDGPLCEQVAFIIEQRCVRCHSDVPVPEGPLDVRLDVFHDDDGGGAVAWAQQMAVLAETGAMPPPRTPEGSVTRDEAQIFRDWANAGAPIDACVSGSGADAGGDAGADVGVDAPLDTTTDAVDDGEGDGGTKAAPTLEDVYNEVFIGCGSHHLNGRDSPWLLLNEGLRDRLLLPSVQLPEMPNVTPGNVAESYLVHKLRATHTDVGGSGVPMPIGPALPEEDIQLIEDWIAAGAE